MVNYVALLEKVVEESSELEGCSIKEAYLLDDENIVLEFEDDSTIYPIRICLNKDFSAFYRVYNYSKPNNVRPCFAQLKNEVLQKIKVVNNDRIISLKFINQELQVILFGRGKSTVNLYINKKIQEAIPQNIFHYFTDDNSLEKIEKSIPKFLKKEFEDFELNDLLELISKSKLKNEYFLYELENEMVVSLIELEKFNLITKFDSPSLAIHKALAAYYSKFAFNKLFTKLNTSLEKKLSKESKRKLQILDSDPLHRAEIYNRNGTLLLTLPNQHEKFGNKITITDWNGEINEIDVDGKISIGKNAEKYFNKSKNAKKENLVNETRLIELDKIIEEYEEKIKRLNEIKNYKMLVVFAKEIGYIEKGDKGIDFNIEKKSKFREFDLGDGYILYVGKNSENNDELTTKFAKQNDIWLHARGTSGSHCILRNLSNKKYPKEKIEKAAEIAAYYSQARNAKYVPVAYTEKKYVRKPKGAHIGQVVMQKEEVILVEPKLPE